MPYKDREKYLSSQKGYYNKNKETYKWRSRLTKHGMTIEDFYNLLEDQENCCALCKEPFRGISGKNLHIDHCHETNKVRGLLCMPCNVGLGMLGDTEEGLIKAIKYIKGEFN